MPESCAHIRTFLALEHDMMKGIKFLQKLHDRDEQVLH